MTIPAVGSLFARGTERLDVHLNLFDSADKAFDYLKTNRPDMLFLSTKMPGRDGLSFLKKLRGSPLHKDTPVVMISSKDYAQDRAIACELGALDFLIKPMPIKVITDVINKHLKA